MIKFKILLQLLLPTFLRGGGCIRAFCNAVATPLQQRCNEFGNYANYTKWLVAWTSERKAMGVMLNEQFNNAEAEIRVEDGYDIEYPIVWNNDEEGTVVTIIDNSDMYDSQWMFICYNIEEMGYGCDLRVVIPQEVAMGWGVNLQKLKNMSNRLIFAGLLCKFYKETVQDNGVIKLEEI